MWKERTGRLVHGPIGMTEGGCSPVAPSPPIQDLVGHDTPVYRYAAQSVAVQVNAPAVLFQGK